MSDPAPLALEADALIDAMASLLALDIDPRYRPGIAANLQATARFAAIVLAVELEDEAEPAPVFVP